MTTTVLYTKMREVENKIPDHAKYNTTQEFNKLTTENLKKDSVSKISFDKKLPLIKQNI